MTMPTLHQLIINGDIDGFRQAIEMKADVNQLDPVMGNSPMHIAAQQDSASWVEALLAAGAFINLQTPKHGVTPLMVAVWHRKPSVVEALLKQPEVNVEIVSTFGLKAEQLVDFGASEQDVFGLQQADQLRQLFDAYRDQRSRSQAQLSAYQLVTDNSLDDEEKARQLKAHFQGITDNAMLNTPSAITSSGNDEHTAVMVAARDGLVESLKVLMEQGGDQTVPDHYMKAIPLHKAAYNGRADVIELLSHYPGFKETLDAQGPNNGYTPLHDAVWHGHTEAAAKLIAFGARTDLTGFDGKTPLELAREYQYSSIVEMLEKKA
ncbi:ankyrin repeat domain-containing protein [Photobacterium rosenbergii]|uniref:Ankyrin repeat domain-containing protein n=1 Tax=Photobacterium rosenbergii TaxID=294936 RepID=A0ABU3ZI12_9GAMM|nr:ankyrin repeat domain-containing protein [Photobacterium rosenbergii]MDV5169726.1 ankyrin repeat domain-containing protein [Photobacterium rosenbergii]